MRRVLLLLLFCALPASASDIYFASVSAGLNNGADCADAYAYNDGTHGINVAANWVAGNTLHICGTITVAANTSIITAQASGTSVSPITIKFETGAILQSPAFPWGGGAIGTNGKQWIVIDGGTNGIIQNTANGTSGDTGCLSGSCTLQQATAGIQLGANTANSNANIEIKNLTIRYMFYRQQNETWPGCPASCMNNTQINAIYVGGDGSLGAVKIHDNTIYYVAWAINVGANGFAGGADVYNNQIYFFDHGYANGLNVTSGTASMSNVKFHDNWIHDPYVFDDPDDSNHHDGIHFFANPGPSTGTMTASNVDVYNNLFDGNWGAHPTAEVFCQFGNGNGTVTTTNIAFYNNIFDGAGFAAASNGNFTCVTQGTGNNVYHNTFIGNASLSQMYCFSPQSFAAGNGAWNVENNVEVNCPIGFYYQPGRFVVVGSWDHNKYENSGTSRWVWNGTNYSTFAAFQTACGCDGTGSSSQTAVDIAIADQVTAPYVGQPNAGSIVTGAAINLTNLGVTALDSDTSLGNNKTPVSRPNTGNWDVGAFVVTASAPTLTFSPTSLAFGSVAVGSSSTLSVVASSSAIVSLTSITISGANATDFSQTNNCGTQINGSCTVSIKFTPSLAAGESASLVFTDNASGSPQSIALSGTGFTAAPVVGFSPASLTFGSQQIGTSSASQQITMTNSGTGPLTISSIGLSGGNSADFSDATDCTGTLAASASCHINVTFTPVATGARSSAVAVADNAAGSPQAVAVSGTGVSAAAVAFNPASATFANQAVGTTSPATSIVMSNTGGSPLSISSIAITGANSGAFAQTNNCGSALGAGSSCSISVTFTPTANGSLSASVSVTDTAAGSPQTISLSGTGYTPAPAVSLSAGSLAFGNQTTGTISNPLTTTLTNTGTAGLSITSIAVTGADPGDFSENNTCGSSVAAGASCVITVTFNPTANGSRTAAVTITDNASGSPHSVGLSGTGVAGAAGANGRGLFGA